MNMFHENHTVSVVENFVADGTSDVVSTVVDMAGHDELTFVVLLGDVDAAAVVTFAVKQNTASSTSSPTPTAVALTTENAAGGVITSGNLVLTEADGNIDNKAIIITVQRNAFTARYLFLTISMTVESLEVNSTVAIQSKPRSLPVTQGSTVYCTAYAAS